MPECPTCGKDTSGSEGWSTGQCDDCYLEEAAPVDAQGVTWDEFVTTLFSCEYCDECGGDAEHHSPGIVMGSWFAVCRFPADEDGTLHRIISDFRHVAEMADAIERKQERYRDDPEAGL